MSVVIAEKPCTVCGEVKPLSEYHRNRARSDGLQGICKDCTRLKMQLHRQRRREEMGEEAWAAHQAAIVATHRQRTNNEKGKAYNRARNRAVSVLIDNHRQEFDHLMLLARRGELELASETTSL